MGVDFSSDYAERCRIEIRGRNGGKRFRRYSRGHAKQMRARNRLLRAGMRGARADYVVIDEFKMTVKAASGK